jgi:hypothetical protein
MQQQTCARVQLVLLILCTPTLVHATVYEVDPQARVVEVYGGWLGGQLDNLTATGFFEAVIDGEQLSFVNTNVHFSPNDWPVSPAHTAILTGDFYTGRQETCHGLGPELWYEARISGETIVIDGRSHHPICGNDGFRFYYHIVAYQPQRIPQLQGTGLLLYIALFTLTGTILITKTTP